MNEYHKIQTLFKRDMERNGKTLLEGQWTLPEFEFLAGNTWVFTEKVDGTNIRVMLKDGAVTFGGKTDAAQMRALSVFVNSMHGILVSGRGLSWAKPPNVPHEGPARASCAGPLDAVVGPREET